MSSQKHTLLCAVKLFFEVSGSPLKTMIDYNTGLIKMRVNLSA